MAILIHIEMVNFLNNLPKNSVSFNFTSNVLARKKSPLIFLCISSISESGNEIGF